nr:immunoglobulin light chain junction region [Macaca mulatta]MOV66837.1 immunoglobulin light chain junction region [Macaca mulatta]MOV67368.1 immunoglobulin light chain junction region [Macaca mulatta]MOV67768.1 immunoglobulin light chain junction region [Macaca mulatta]MOV68780.1 immunoglobulin light chain junction region [Macaca mulatta]
DYYCYSSDSNSKWLF